MKRLIVLGSTGSIGKNTLEVVRKNPQQFKIIALAAHSNYEELAKQCQEFRPEAATLFNSATHAQFKNLNHETPLFSGMDGLLNLVNKFDYDYLVNSIVGSIGLMPTYEAIGRAQRICLANKESLVMGGTFITKKLENYPTELIPIDSEHSAIFQSIGKDRQFLQKIILTASGGPFYFKPHIDFSSITPKDALKHPTWNMGKKITIDSATLFNKALEIIEAYYLFNLNPNQIEVVIHPQSYIHSFVEFIDGSQIAQMSQPDMKIPIQYSLTYPQRIISSHKNPNFWELEKLTFAQPDVERYPSLKLAFESLKSVKILPTVLNAANEVAVELFFQQKISFAQIFQIVEKAFRYFSNENIESIEELLVFDQKIRQWVQTNF